MSASTQKNARSRRGRVLVVGDAGEAQLARLDELLAQPARRVSNMFEAIGQVSAGGAGDSIAAIILDQRAWDSPHERATEALRRVDPSVRILGIAGQDESPATTQVRTIDAWLTMPLRADELKRAMDDDGLLASSASANSANAAAANSSPPSAVPTAAIPNTTSPPSSSGIIDLPDEEPARLKIESEHKPMPASESTVNVLAAKSEAPDRTTNSQGNARTATPSLSHPPRVLPGAPAASVVTGPTTPQASPVASSDIAGNRPTAAASGAGAIGDTDLISAILHEPAGVAPLALQLIAHHGRWENVRIISDESTPQHEGVEISAGTHRFGILVADHAQPAALRPWADWLAQWLHMDAEHRQLRHEANTDDLTGACNRRFFERFLTDAIARARPLRRPVTVMVFDIDNFKPYNDRFGHEAGDDILREIVRLMQSVIRQGDVVCRIGGDEFAVVFADAEAPRTPGSTHPESVESIARRFQQAVCSMRFPKLGSQALGTISVSAGLASFPWDGQDHATLLRIADHRTLESKSRGKNALTFGPCASD